MISDVYFHSSDPMTSPWPYQIAAGGRTEVSATDGNVSRNYHQHTLILTLSGQGRIKTADGVFSTAPGSVVWLDTSCIYAHGAAQRHEWSYLWIALSGQGLERLFEQSGFAEQPVQDCHRDLASRFETLIQTLADPPIHADANLNAQFAAIAADLFANRQGGANDTRDDPIALLMRRLRKDVSSAWSVAQMAAIRHKIAQGIGST